MMKKTILLFLTLAMLLNVSCSGTSDVSVTPRQSRTYLIAGIDDAAENTDVLILAAYNMADGTSTVVHIPRDTFCKYGGKYRKINSIFPYERNKGATKDEAMSYLASYISDTFGVVIDGYFCIDRETLIEAVDLMGGVDIELDRELLIKGAQGEILLELNAGENHLNGEQAARFIRYRKGYTDGDLGRINAQKMFLSALFRRAQKEVGIDDAARMYVAIMPRITTNVGVTELLEILFNARINKGKKDADCITLPGEALTIDNASFYVIHRKSAAELFYRDFSLTNKGFDSERLLTDKSNRAVEDIYGTI